MWKFLVRCKEFLVNTIYFSLTLLSVVPYIIALVLIGMLYLAALLAGPMLVTWLIVKLLELYFVVSIYIGVAIFLVLIGVAMAVMVRIF